MLQHAFVNAAHYRTSWDSQLVSSDQFKSQPQLSLLPILTKADVVTGYESLSSDQLFPGDSRQGFSKTSGTTGQPVMVQQTIQSRGLFAWLKQRELRWFGFDPNGTHLSIRPGEELALSNDGSRWPDGDLLKLPGWPYLHSIFETGPGFGVTSTTLVETQVELLETVSPDYLLMEPATLENLAMQALRDTAKEKLQGIQAISQTLTSAMKSTIEKALQTEVQQNYGLNEIGLVASRCPEGGRYHVHEEHCLVEIIDAEGQPVTAGERGSIVVTTLTNSAMPLIRYDTEDSAVLCEDNCPCGRTLPSFTEIEGRYRRLAQLPDGSYQRFKAIQAAVNQYARSHPSAVYQYQVCQQLDGIFRVILHSGSTGMDELEAEINKAFHSVAAGNPVPPLEIVYGRSFLGLDKRKFQIFYSEFMPDDNAAGE